MELGVQEAGARLEGLDERRLHLLRKLAAGYELPMCDVEEIDDARDLIDSGYGRLVVAIQP